MKEGMRLDFSRFQAKDCDRRRVAPCGPIHFAKEELTMLTRLVSTFMIFITTLAFAQETQPTTTGAAGEAQKLTVIVTGIEGSVRVRANDAAAWQKVELGMELTEDAEFQTGPRSAVRFVIPPDQTITLDRLGTVKVVRAIEENGTIKTDLGMKYGRTRYDIDAGGRQHEAAIRSPSSTLAVRGTQVSLYDQRPFIPEAVSLTGRANFRDFRKSLAFGGPGAGKTKVSQAASSAAAYAMEQAVVDPTIARARTAQEQQLVDTLISRGSFVFFDRQAGIDVVTGGIPPNDRQLRSILPGKLNFVLRWSGNADLNLNISALLESTEELAIFPVGGLNVSRDGGKTSFDHRGGPNGGIEIVHWPAGFSNGQYSIGVVHISGEKAVARISAYRDGRKIDITDFTNGYTKTIRKEIEPGGGTAAFAFVGVPAPPLGFSVKAGKAPVMGPLPRSKGR
jgi:hypothetical protein